MFRRRASAPIAVAVGDRGEVGASAAYAASGGGVLRSHALNAASVCGSAFDDFGILRPRA